MTKDAPKEDIRHSLVFCCMLLCVTIITGASVCLNTYINAVYQLKVTDAQNLRYHY